MTREAAVKTYLEGLDDPSKVLSDVELVRKSQSGDRDAFSELVRRHQHLVYNVAYRFMRDATQAEDQAQESFIKAYRLLKGFRGDCSFSTWMYRVTATTCLTELNKRKKRAEVELIDESFSHTSDTEHQPTVKDRKEHIRRCVRLLPDRYATVVTLYYLKGISYLEIAEPLGVPEGTLKTWMFRARKMLRKIVEKELSKDDIQFHSPS